MKTAKKKLTFKEISTTYADFWRGYFKFKGVTGRRAYGITFIINLLIIAILGVLFLWFVGWLLLSQNNPTSMLVFYSITALLAVWVIGSALPQITLTIRRLRDVGLSFWWYLAKVVLVGLVQLSNSYGNLLGWVIELVFLFIMFRPSHSFGHKLATVRTSKNTIPATEQLTSADNKQASTQQDLNVPITNPQLEQYFELLADKPQEQAEALEAIFRYIAVTGRFLLVVKTDAAIDGQATTDMLQKGSKFSFLLLTNTANETLLPIFSNWVELRTWQQRPSDQALVVGFEDIAAIVLDHDDAGLSLDPFTKNFVIGRQQIKHMHDQKNIEQHGHTTDVIKKATEMQIGEPADYPTEMVAVLKAQLPAITDVKQVWLQWAVRDGEGSYLLLLDHTGDRALLSQKIGAIVTPYSRGHYVDIVESQSFSAALAIVDPIYTRH